MGASTTGCHGGSEMEEEEEGEWADPPPMCVAAAMGIRGALEDEPRPSSWCAGGRGGPVVAVTLGRAELRYVCNVFVQNVPQEWCVRLIS